MKKRNILLIILVVIFIPLTIMVCMATTDFTPITDLFNTKDKKKKNKTKEEDILDENNNKDETIFAE